jgi:RNA polymerase sigma-70 factor (ECF subfamily)
MSSTELPSTHLSLLRRLDGAGSRDDEAWGAFLRRYRPLLRRWCRRWRLQPADSDDLLAAVELRLVEAVRGYDPAKGRFRAWLKAVVNNAARNELRRRERHPGDRGSGDSAVHDRLREVEASADELAGELEQELAADLERALADVKARVDPADWEVFWLRYAVGLSVDEVSARLGLGRGGVYQAAYRVRRLVREAHARRPAGGPPRGVPQ